MSPPPPRASIGSTVRHVPFNSHPLVEAFLGSLTVKPTTVRDYKADLRYFERWCRTRDLDLLDVTDDDLSRYVHDLQSGQRASTTIVRYGLSIRILYEWLHARGHVAVNPALHISKKYTRGAPTDVLTTEELRRLVAATADDPVSRSVITLMSVTGLSAADVEAAKVTDLRSTSAGWELRLALHDSAPMPLPPLVSEAVLKAVGSRRRGALLLNSRGNPMDRAAMTRVIARSVAKAGLNIDVSPRTLTFTMRSTSINEGVTLLEVAHGLPTLGEQNLMLRARSSPPPPQHVSFHLSAIVTDKRDSTDALLDQADALANLKFVHSSVRLMLAGAAFERHLRLLAVTQNHIPPDQIGDMMFYAGALRRAGAITEAEVQLIPDVAQQRNNAAHGRLESVSADDISRTIATIRRLVKAHPL
jgi:site-specific recombinase XerD